MTVDLVPTWQVGDVELTRYPFSVDREDGVEVGEPAMVVETVASMLADGDVERVVRHGNRTYVIPVYIEGADLADLAASEALLRSELQRPGLEMAHNPGDDFSPTSVYEVGTAALTPSRSDSLESHLMRKFTVTLTCSPFARSAELVTVPALTTGATPSTVVVDTCDSTTGWTASTAPPTGVTFASTGGYLHMETGPLNNGSRLTLSRSGIVDTTETPYVAVEWRWPTATGGPVTLNGARPVADSLLTGGWRLAVFHVPAAVSTLEFSRQVSDGGDDTVSGYTFEIREVRRSNVPPGASPFQATRIVETGGTERTPASITVKSPDETAPLGRVIVHTCPEDGSGYSPPLRRWRTAGQLPTDDAGMISGAYESITGAGVRYDTPTSALPEGAYVLAALMRRSSEGPETIAWSTSTIFPGGSTEQGFTNGSEVVTFADTNWTLVPLAVVTLPTVRTQAGLVRTILQAPTTGGPTTYVDEAWLFRVDDDCALTVVEAGGLPFVWLNSPGVDEGVPTVWMGDRSSTKVHPGAGLRGMAAHVLSPDGTAIFACTEARSPHVEATYYRRWHSNAAE